MVKSGRSGIVALVSIGLVLLCLFPGCGNKGGTASVPAQVPTMQDEPDGFRGIKFGDSVKDHKKLKHDDLAYISNWFLGKGAVSTKWYTNDYDRMYDTNYRRHPILGRMKAYYLPHDDGNLGGYKIGRDSAYPDRTDVRYYFYKGRFFYAEVKIPSLIMSEERQQEFLKMLTEK